MTEIGVTPSLTNMPAPQTAEQQRAMDLAVEFESFFLYQMLELAKPKDDGGLYGDSFGGGIYQQMMNEEISANMAGNAGVGLAEAVYRQLIREQEQGGQ